MSRDIVKVDMTMSTDPILATSAFPLLSIHPILSWCPTFSLSFWAIWKEEIMVFLHDPPFSDSRHNSTSVHLGPILLMLVCILLSFTLTSFLYPTDPIPQHQVVIHTSTHMQ